MARIARSPASETYRELISERDAHGENRDCSVIALSVACCVSYAAAREALSAAGRKDAQGASITQIHDAAKALGYRVERVDLEEMIAQYPGTHKNLKSVTSHHPQRFNGVWADGHRYLFYTDRHVAAVDNGTLHDWTAGRAFRIQAAYRVIAN